MDVYTAAMQRRSIRRFTQEPLAKDALQAMMEAARLSPTGVNRQPLQFAAVSSPALCHTIFPHTRWAGRIPDGSAGPTEQTQPTAYIAILVDQTIAGPADTDAGAASMSILLTAQSLGIASCWLGSIDRASILSLLQIDPERFALHTIIALGYPAMQSQAVPMTGSTDYFLTSPDLLSVPKRETKDVLHWYE